MFNKLVDVEEFKNVMPYFSTACKDLFLPGTVEASIISSIDFPSSISNSSKETLEIKNNSSNRQFIHELEKTRKQSLGIKLQNDLDHIQIIEEKTIRNGDFKQFKDIQRRKYVSVQLKTQQPWSRQHQTRAELINDLKSDANQLSRSIEIQKSSNIKSPANLQIPSNTQNWKNQAVYLNTELQEIPEAKIRNFTSPIQHNKQQQFADFKSIPKSTNLRFNDLNLSVSIKKNDGRGLFTPLSNSTQIPVNISYALPKRKLDKAIKTGIPHTILSNQKKIDQILEYYQNKKDKIKFANSFEIN